MFFFFACFLSVFWTCGPRRARRATATHPFLPHARYDREADGKSVSDEEQREAICGVTVNLLLLGFGGEVRHLQGNTAEARNTPESGRIPGFEDTTVCISAVI